MRASVLFSSVVTLLALASCGTTAPSDAAQTGGVTSSGGQDQSGGAGGGSGGSAGSGGITSSGGATAAGGTTGSGGITSSGGTTSSGGRAGSGGTTSSGGITATGGTKSSGGSSASGGTTLSGGTTSSGGQPGSGGTTASGGIVASGGTKASGGITGSGGQTGTGGTTVAYQGPCDLLASGCAEAYSVARAMTASYTGPLLQLGKTSDKTATLDIAQTGDHKADMTTWSAFCGGNQSNCVVAKIYAQIHKGSNDLLPGVWKTQWNPDCSAGGYTCAAKFTIESATGLPIVTTVSPQEYALSNDNAATGINGGSKAMGIMYNGKPVANQVYCCGVIGLTHRYDATDTTGTDFMLALAYGWKDSNGCCIATNCGASNKYCVGAEEEENNDMYDYGSSPVDNAMVVTQFDPTANAVIIYLNSNQAVTKSPPKAGKLNAGTRIHLGGGGDLSQPDPVLMREALFTNNVMSASEVTAMMANIQAVFTTLKFP